MYDAENLLGTRITLSGSFLGGSPANWTVSWLVGWLGFMGGWLVGQLDTIPTFPTQQSSCFPSAQNGGLGALESPSLHLLAHLYCTVALNSRLLSNRLPQTADTWVPSKSPNLH